MVGVELLLWSTKKMRISSAMSTATTTPISSEQHPEHLDLTAVPGSSSSVGLRPRTRGGAGAGAGADGAGVAAGGVGGGVAGTPEAGTACGRGRTAGATG